MDYRTVWREVTEALDHERAADGGSAAYDVTGIIDSAYICRRNEYRMAGSTETFWSVADSHKRSAEGV